MLQCDLGIEITIWDAFWTEVRRGRILIHCEEDGALLHVVVELPSNHLDES